MSENDDLTLVLKPPRRQGLAILTAVSGVCVAVGFLMAMTGGAHFLAWLGLGFAGIGGVYFASHLLPADSALVLSQEGFAVRYANRAEFYSWSEVERFAVLEPHLVVFRLLDESERVSPVARRLTGYDGALPAVYGSLSAEALAARLNDCRRHLTDENTPSGRSTTDA